MSCGKLLAAVATMVVLLAVAGVAEASGSRRFRSCRPSVGTDIKVSGAKCKLARRVVADSFVKSKPIPGTQQRGFTVDGFRCRVTQMGVENKPIPARYRCQRRRVVITWAYHP